MATNKTEGEHDFRDGIRDVLWSIRDLLVQGGILKEADADSLYNLAVRMLAMVPATPAATPLDAEFDRLVKVIEVEMKRSATNLGTILRTACRDTPTPVLNARINEIVKLHLHCERILVDTLLGTRMQSATGDASSPRN